jgi:hypothetical protein
MMQNINGIALNEGTALRELSLDETEMVGGGFSWGGLLHKAEGIAHTAIHNIESHNWNQVGNDALNGAKIGAAAGGVIGIFAGDPGAGAAYGGAIGTLAGADYALIRQDL